MPRTKRNSETPLSKFQRYRRAQAKKGMRLLRIWAPDPRRPEFAREAERQAKLLRGRAEEREALDFIEAVVDWPDDAAPKE